MGVVKAIKGLNRLKRIADVLVSQGLGFIVDELKLNPYVSFKKKITKKEKEVLDHEIPVRLRKSMEKLGGGFIKLGQLLAMRPDLLPKDYCDEFSKLLDKVKPFEGSTAKKIIEEETGKKIKEMFLEFDEKPVAAASVGQVHKAKLKTGEWVAIKVQRPNVKEIFETDVDILKFLSKQAEKRLTAIKPYRPQQIVKEFEAYTKKELNYKTEGKNLEYFYQKERKHGVVIPKVFWEYTTEKVLVMEFIEGVNVVEKLNKLSKKEKKRIAMEVIDSVARQILYYHSFHGDPHLGNIFLMKNGKIAFLDFGIIGKISPKMREAIGEIMLGLVKKDIDFIVRGLVDMGAFNDDVDEVKFTEELYQKMHSFYGVELKTIDIGEFYETIMSLVRKYNIQLPDNFVLIMKCLATSESVARMIYPEANFVKIVEPYVDKMIKDKKDPKKIYHSVKDSAFKWSGTLKRLPQDLRSIMHVIKHGAKVNIDIDHRDVRNLTDELDRSSDRITLGIVIGALVIGASLVVLSGINPVVWGIPIISMVMFVLIGVLTLMLMLSILRGKRI